MKRPNYLKGLRVILAILIFVPILLFFVDFADILPDSVSRLLHLQILPALLAGMAGILVFQFVLALLFGRIYCSVICPAGVLQDGINRIFCIGKKKKNGIRRFKYHAPQNLLRYALLALTFGFAVFGFTGFCLLLGPYSNFGRIANNLFRPVVMWGNNLLADGLMRIDNYSLYHVTIGNISTAGWVSATVALTVFIVLVVFRGRLFCNTLCPVGALLSLISRYSFFRISFDKTACTHCGNCEHTCKAEAIDSRNLTIDASRCVDCFNCISSCAKGGLQYRFQPFFKKEASSECVPSAKEAIDPSVSPVAISPENPGVAPCVQPVANPSAISPVHSTAKQTVAFRNEGPGASRRTFLATGVSLAASLPVVSAIAEEVKAWESEGDGSDPANDSNQAGGKRRRKKGSHAQKWPPVTPPGSLSLERFKDKCTACHICVVQCPSHVLRPAGLEYGFDYLLKPRVAYIDSYCNYECTVCSEVCPTHAIQPLTKEEKATTQVGIATFFINRCIVHTEETDCGACSEHCPTQAVHMVPYKGTLTIPAVNPDLCIGCGGCESICPVRPMRAIIIKSNEVHKFVEKPRQEEEKKVEVEDFGF